MRISHIAAYLALVLPAVQAVSLADHAPARRDEHALSVRSADILSPAHALERRKGGGGRGGGGGGSSSGGRSGSSGGTSSRTGATSNVGGATSRGSGPSRSFAGGGFYGGGASVPYSAGKKSHRGLVPGALLGGAALLLIMPGLWLYSVYPYHFTNPYRFVNESLTNATFPNGTNVSLPVTCLCQEYQVCGCDENDDQNYIRELVGNGSYAALNKSLVTVSDVNGTQTLVLNGSLPNGTTAPGGSDDDSAAVMLGLGKYGGYWVMGLIVVYTCAFM